MQYRIFTNHIFKNFGGKQNFSELSTWHTLRVKDEHGNIVLKESDTSILFKIDAIYTLNGYPTHNKDIDVYKLIDGNIEEIPHDNFLVMANMKIVVINLMA